MCSSDLIALAQHQVRHALGRHVLPALLHLCDIWGHGFKTAAAVQHMVAIDLGDGGQIRGGGGLDQHEGQMGYNRRFSACR